VDEKTLGGLALTGAYGHQGNDRAVELLQEAEAGGVDEDETCDLWWYSEHIRSLAAELRDEHTDRGLRRHARSDTAQVAGSDVQARSVLEGRWDAEASPERSSSRSWPRTR
jgi:hypothetical protein